MRVCEMEGCERPHHARGWCPMHYQRWLKHGDPNVVTERPLRPCGTQAAYKRHRRRDEPPCDPCREANAAAKRRAYAARKSNGHAPPPLRKVWVVLPVDHPNEFDLLDQHIAGRV